MRPAWNVILVNLLLVASLGLFVVGIFAPLMTVRKWWVFEDTYSLCTGLLQLWREEQYVLFAIVLSFSLLLPLVKIGTVALVSNRRAWREAHLRRLLHWLALFGKWSMLDVFIAAVLVVAGKLGGVARVQIHYGLYVFAASVIAIHVATCRLETLLQPTSCNAAHHRSAGNRNTTG
jgi:paraquat-inducible protein A